MSAAAGKNDALTIASEDPRAGDALVLWQEMDEFVKTTYPEDEENGVIPTTVDALATKGEFLVARIDGEAVGTGTLMPLAIEPLGSVMEVKCMYVRPAARGKRVAERVLQQLEVLAAARGASDLKLQCGPRQPAALRLYERNGYSVCRAYVGQVDHPLSIFFEKTLPETAVRRSVSQ